jgi:hypothetical protein
MACRHNRAGRSSRKDAASLKVHHVPQYHSAAAAAAAAAAAVDSGAHGHATCGRHVQHGTSSLLAQNIIRVTSTATNAYRASNTGAQPDTPADLS